jgi:hypothetical protein
MGKGLVTAKQVKCAINFVKIIHKYY